MPDLRINSLDEYLIQDLLLQDAKIDLFGVGERLITAQSEPVFGGVYKLAAVEDQQGNITPKIKISENVEKITIPHFKKVYRFYGNDTGKAIADYITVYDETLDDTKDLRSSTPAPPGRKKRRCITSPPGLCWCRCFWGASGCTTAPACRKFRPTAASRWTPCGTR